MLFVAHITSITANMPSATFTPT